MLHIKNAVKQPQVEHSKVRSTECSQAHYGIPGQQILHEDRNYTPENHAVLEYHPRLHSTLHQDCQLQPTCGNKQKYYNAEAQKSRKYKRMGEQNTSQMITQKMQHINVYTCRYGEQIQSGAICQDVSCSKEKLASFPKSSSSRTSFRIVKIK